VDSIVSLATRLRFSLRCACSIGTADLALWALGFPDAALVDAERRT
jgi:hypothetical protein